MKIKKLLPIMMALMLLAPAYAATATNNQTKADSTMTLNLPEFIRITKESSVDTAGVTYTDDYKTLTLDAAMGATFKVITNKPDDTVYLTATTPVSGTDTKALFGTKDAMTIAFANIDRAPASAAALSAAAADTKTDESANAIAFAVTATATGDTATGADAEPTIADLADGNLKYTLKNGEYTFVYALAQQALGFSTHDTYGTYKATLTLSQTQL